jgi:tetratricopeptide (TPR) repeat protein
VALPRWHRATVLAVLLSGAAAGCQEPQPAPAVLRERALGAERRGSFAAAADAYLQLVASEPDEPRWVAGAGRCLGRSGRFNDALDLLQRKRARFPAEPDLPALLARTLLLKAESDPGAIDPHGYLEQAVEIAGQALQLDPAHLEAMLIVAQGRYLLGDTDAAAAAATAAAGRHPTHAGCWILVGRIHADRYRALLAEHADATGERRELSRGQARHAFERAIALDPSRPFPHVALAGLYAADDVDRTLRHFADALVLDPDAVDDHGWIEERAPDRRATFYREVLARYLERPLPDASKAATLRFYLGRALYDQGRFADAAPLFAQALRDNPAHANAAYYAAMASHRLEDHEEAERFAAEYAAASAPAFADVVRVLPEAPREEVTALVRYLADRAFGGGRIERSRDLNHVLACLQDTADAWNNWALLCRETRRFEDSLEGYRRALEKEPDSPQLLNDTAVILHYHVGTDAAREQARGMYRRAIAEAGRVQADRLASAEQKARAARARSDAEANLKELGGR